MHCPVACSHIGRQSNPLCRKTGCFCSNMWLYCAFEDFSPDGDSHYLVDFPFIENDYHYDMLLGFGNNCECLEPPHVRENMKRKIHALSVMYEK